MSDINEKICGELPYENNAKDLKVGLLSPLNQMLDDNPKFKNTFHSLMGILGDDFPSEENAQTEVDGIEIDGHDSIVA